MRVTDFRVTEQEEAFWNEVRDFLSEMLPHCWPRMDPDRHNEQAEDS
ncbi:hypothetical protein ACFLXE_00935 [Chloroflexota bacterium]